MKKLLIFGASGFVGSHLLNSSNGVFNTIGYSRTGAHIQMADITDLKQLETIFDLEKPDAVINAAALSDIDYADANKDQAWKINVLGAENLALLCHQYKAKYVFFSSDAVFSGFEDAYDEQSETKPVNYYGETKVAAEKAILKACPTAAIMRISLVIGFPIDDGNSFFLKLKRTLSEGKTVAFPLDEYRTPIEVKTLCECSLELAQNDFKGIIHVGATDYKNRYEIAQYFALKAGFDLTLIQSIPHVIPSEKAPRHKNGILITTQAQQLLKTKLDTVEQFIDKSFTNQ